MTTQEELSTLFSRNLNLHNTYVAPPQPEPTPAAEEPIIYSISQHYNHSAHIRPARPASEPPQTDQLTAEIILARHGVDSSALFPSQIDLFKTAAPEQQMRLVELWRICPPDYCPGNLAQDLGSWPTTSFEQEESMAKLRYERQILEERMSRAGGDIQSMDSDTMSDSSTAMPLTPIQGGDGRWANNHVEPYMASGYEALAQREYEASANASKDSYSHFGTAVGGPSYTPATDPVYKKVDDIDRYPNVGSDWQAHDEQRQMAMENQYGAFLQQFQHNSGGVTMAEDEEML